MWCLATTIPNGRKVVATTLSGFSGQSFFHSIMVASVSSVRPAGPTCGWPRRWFPGSSCSGWNPHSGNGGHASACGFYQPLSARRVDVEQRESPQLRHPERGCFADGPRPQQQVYDFGGLPAMGRSSLRPERSGEGIILSRAKRTPFSLQKGSPAGKPFLSGPKIPNRAHAFHSPSGQPLAPSLQPLSVRYGSLPMRATSAPELLSGGIFVCIPGPTATLWHAMSGTAGWCGPTKPVESFFLHLLSGAAGWFVRRPTGTFTDSTCVRVVCCGAMSPENPL